MKAHQLIEFLTLIEDIKPSYMSTEEAIRDLEFTENILANVSGLNRLRKKWKEVLSDRMQNS